MQSQYSLSGVIRLAYGLLANRPRDFAGLAVVYGSYNSDLRHAEEAQAVINPSVTVQSREMTVELIYGCTIRPRLLVQPSLQYIVNPSGDKSISNALSLGINLVVKFRGNCRFQRFLLMRDLVSLF